MALPAPKDMLALYTDAKNIRAPFEPDMRAASAYCLPQGYSAWQTAGGPTTNAGTQAARRLAYDNTGVRSLPKYAATLERLATPQGMRWVKLQADDPELMKIWSVRDFFDKLGNNLFKMRYHPRAGFVQATGELYTSVGVYGAGPVSITRRQPSWNDKRGGFRYKAWPVRDIFILVDDFGNITHVFRRFWINARQFKAKFPDVTPPGKIAAELKKPAPSETAMFEFVHIVCERGDYDIKSISMNRHPLVGLYLCIDDCEYVGKEEGFGAWPYLIPRVTTEAGAAWGFSPAVMALPALGGVSQMKKTMLKVGHKSADPPLLIYDDGVLSNRTDIRPGSTIVGGLNAQGQRRVQEMTTGANFPLNEKLIEDERRDIEDSFFVTLFTILTERPEMTATQVLEEVAQKAALLSPTMGRLQSEFLGPNIETEIALAAEYGDMPPMPPELIEAKGQYNAVYTSPMAKNIYAEEVSSFFRLKELLVNEAGVTGDPSGLDWFNNDVAIPEIADQMSVRTAWVATNDEVKAKREARAEQMQTEQAIKAAPAAASVAGKMMDKEGASP